MTLSPERVERLREAIKNYSFPAACYDFRNRCPLPNLRMSDVEHSIRCHLTSGDPLAVKDGLSNVLYWGYAQIGYRDIRVSKFREKVRSSQLEQSALLFKALDSDGLMAIKALGLPEFSGMSFISKIRMFLDPKHYVVLDQQIIRMRELQPATLLHEISFGPHETQLRVSKRNVEVYRAWCRKCSHISETYFGSAYRAVDIERGFFKLIQDEESKLAAEILSEC